MCSLLYLPKEIRLLIIEFSVLIRDPVTIQQAHFRPIISEARRAVLQYAPFEQRVEHYPLLLVNLQLRSETLGLLNGRSQTPFQIDVILRCDQQLVIEGVLLLKSGGPSLRPLAEKLRSQCSSLFRIVAANVYLASKSIAKDTIIDILEALRNEERSQRFITLVRSNASLEQIRQFVARDLSIDTSSKREKYARGSGLADSREIMAIEYLTSRHQYGAALEANFNDACRIAQALTEGQELVLYDESEAEIVKGHLDGLSFLKILDRYVRGNGSTPGGNCRFILRL
ncbi:hypothetical protein BJX66DRAFT_320620 [Aspergillus keveii]|uniref:Uncharacterized protein n=1 Tax=Aspergillus keveii TaxID=714993 RepID=A0ABR4FGW2_9EURO